MNLRIRHVSKLYKDIYALKDVSLDINNGDFITILGESGSGKTTFLKVISKLLERSSGDIFYDDISIDTLSNLDVSYVFQDNNLYPNKTVFDNIILGNKKIIDFEKEKEEILNILDLFGIRHLASVLPNKLSVGQMQKVALAKIYYKKSSLILLDEPMSNIDESSKKDIIKYLLFLKKELKNSTFIYVTHNYLETITLSNKYVFLNEGRIINILSKHYLSQFKGDILKFYNEHLNIDFFYIPCNIKNDSISILGNNYDISIISSRLLEKSDQVLMKININNLKKKRENNSLSLNFKVLSNENNKLVLSLLEDSQKFSLYTNTNLEVGTIIRMYYSFDDIELYKDNIRITSSYPISYNKLDLINNARAIRRLRKDQYKYLFIPYDSLYVSSEKNTFKANLALYEDEFDDYKITYFDIPEFDYYVAVKTDKNKSYLDKKNIGINIKMDKIYYY